MFNLLLKAAVASLAVVGATTAWRVVSRGAADPVPPAGTSDAGPLPAAQLARIDHDLRTPIGTIANTIELLRGLAPESDASHEAFEVIERQVRRLTTLTAELHEVVASQSASDFVSGGADQPMH